MIKFKNIDVYGWETAIRGARNPMNSWDKMDSYMETYTRCIIGPNDYKLLKNLCIAGTDHRKWMRMINVTMDVIAPLYWFKEYDTYKVGTVANSCSTMHKIHDKKFTLDDFSHEHLNSECEDFLCDLIKFLNEYRILFNRDRGKNNDKEWWWQMIQLLPSSYNQKRTVQLNYEVLSAIYHARKNHKLDEWRNFCLMIEDLPYSEFITGKYE